MAESKPPAAKKQTTYQDFIPKFYFRFDKQYLERGTNQPLFRASLRYANKLGLPYFELLRKVKKGIKDEQLDKVTSCYLNFGISAKGQTHPELLYIWSFIKDWYAESCQTAGIVPSLVQDGEVESVELIFDNKLQKQRLKAGKIKAWKPAAPYWKTSTSTPSATTWPRSAATRSGLWL